MRKYSRQSSNVLQYEIHKAFAYSDLQNIVTLRKSLGRDYEKHGKTRVLNTLATEQPWYYENAWTTVVLNVLFINEIALVLYRSCDRKTNRAFLVLAFLVLEFAVSSFWRLLKVRPQTFTLFTSRQHFFALVTALSSSESGEEYLLRFTSVGSAWFRFLFPGD